MCCLKPLHLPQIVIATINKMGFVYLKACAVCFYASVTVISCNVFPSPNKEQDLLVNESIKNTESWKYERPAILFSLICTLCLSFLMFSKLEPNF